MDSLDNITEVLIMQHRSMQSCLDDIKTLIKITDQEIELVNIKLKAFAKTLSVHVHLEENIFYPELLKQMENRSLDISKTVEFINRVREIRKVIEAFSDKYNCSEKIKNYLTDFDQELINVIEKLKIMIDSEEFGVFCYWKVLRGDI